MHIAFLSNPASGEVNVQLATAQQLVFQGHSVTFLSAESCRGKVERFRMAQQPGSQHRIRFISLGSGRSVDDFTTYNQKRLHLMRRVPGDPISLQTCTDTGLGPADEHARTAMRVRDHINALDPDMICIDVLTSPLVTGARLTKRKFILTVPCSPGMTALSGAFEPHMVAAKRGGSWGTFFENIYLNMHELIHSRTHPDRRGKHKIIKCLGLKSYGASRDSAVLQPHWEDDNCVAGIHFNTPGLIDCPKQSSKMIFVGAGLSSESSPLAPAPTPTPTPTAPFPELAWMNEAALLNQSVVYMNMGSMFIWQPHEFRACIEGFKAAHRHLSGRVRFLFKINTNSTTTIPTSKEQQQVKDSLPPFIRLTNWIETQHAIYSHPALKAFIHHGGGNSFNEAVHFAIPQLVLSQWLDTHEYAGYAEKFGLGLRSTRPPYIDAGDIERKLLTLLGPRWPDFKASCRSWALRSQLGGGVVAAAKVVLFHAETERAARAGNGNGTATRIETELTPPLSPVQASTPLVEKDPGAVVVCS